jgi:hypothetical protein
VPTATSNIKQLLFDYLLMLSEGIECQEIQSEADVEQMFRVETDQQLALWKRRGIEKSEKNSTLLEILGYSSADVDDHPVKKVIVGQISYAPDYILKCQQKILAIVELKAPGQNLDRDRWIGQINSYCRELKVPIGLLFNGTDLRVFINTEIKGLTKHKELFYCQPVASARTHEMKQMVDILLKLSASSLDDNPLIVANSFASKRRSEIRDRDRQKQLQYLLKLALTNPSAEVLTALSTLDSIWGNADSKPSEQELISAWSAIQASSTQIKHK